MIRIIPSGQANLNQYNYISRHVGLYCGRASPTGRDLSRVRGGGVCQPAAAAVIYRLTSPLRRDIAACSA